MSRLSIDLNTKLGKTITKYDELIQQLDLSEKEIKIIQMYTECSDSFLYTTMYEQKETNKERFETFKRRYHGRKYLLSHSKLIILDSIISKFKTKDELVVYRGTHEKKFQNVSVANNDKITLLPPTSTSIRRDIVYDYISREYPLLLEIHLPQNTQALWLKPFSLYPTECEFLLNSKSQFVIEEETTEPIKDIITKKIVLAKIS